MQRRELRDRPGGHESGLIHGLDGWKTYFSQPGRKFVKRVSVKRLRREHRRIEAEALRVWYEDQAADLIEMTEEERKFNLFCSDMWHSFEDWLDYRVVADAILCIYVPGSGA